MGVTQRRQKRGVPEGLFLQCPACKATLYKKVVEERQNVCPECNYHFYISARDRIRFLLDEDSFEEWFTDLMPTDPLGFADRKPYSQRLKDEQAPGLSDAAVVGRGLFAAGRSCSRLPKRVFDGSMGSWSARSPCGRARELNCRWRSSRQQRARMRRHFVADADGGSPPHSAASTAPADSTFPFCQPNDGRRGRQFRSLGDIILPSPKRSSVSPARTHLGNGSIRSCPRAFRPASFFEHGFVDRIVTAKTCAAS